MAWHRGPGGHQPQKTQPSAGPGRGGEGGRQEHTKRKEKWGWVFRTPTCPPTPFPTHSRERRAGRARHERVDRHTPTCPHQPAIHTPSSNALTGTQSRTGSSRARRPPHPPPPHTNQPSTHRPQTHSQERRAGRVRHERVDRHVGALRAEDCVHRGDVLRRNVGRTKDDQQARTRRGGPGAATAAEARRRRRHDALNEAERPGQRSREGGAAARRWGCWEKGRKGQSNRALRSWVQCGTARMRRRGS
eukprot:364957-Chlamydomonas_euryale.AAC.2